MVKAKPTFMFFCSLNGLAVSSGTVLSFLAKMSSTVMPSGIGEYRSPPCIVTRQLIPKTLLLRLPTIHSFPPRILVK